MWTIVTHEEYERGRRRYEKKHPRELTAALVNLNTFFRALNAGAKPCHARFGFIHAEPMGVLAIDQKGGGPALVQTRLYVYPDDKAQQLHILTIGDKKSQRDDIASCKQVVANLQQKSEHSNGKD